MALKVFVSVNDKAIRNGDIFGYWELNEGDTAQPIYVPRFSDKSVHMFAPADGAWGGATVKMQGGNDPDGVNFQDIYDFEGTTISQTADRKPWVILPNLYAIKPVITNGSGTKVRVAIVGRGGLV